MRLTNLGRVLNLRLQERCCYSCRYFRLHTTGTTSANCLLLGRALAVSDRSSEHVYWARARLCDGWKYRPKNWVITSDGVDFSPFWHDPYVSREIQERLRERIAKRGSSL